MRTLFEASIASAEIQPELRATKQRFQCTVARENGQAQRSTGYLQLRCPGVQVGCAES